MLAATVSVDLARLLLDLLIVLVSAKAAAEVCERVQVPGVLGEIAAGILIGPSVLGLVELGDQRGISVGLLAEIGVLLLLLSVGMEMDLAELGKVGTAALAVAVIGVVVPFALGGGTALAFGMDTNAAIFFGAALTATSVGITARVFGDLRARDRRGAGRARCSRGRRRARVDHPHRRREAGHRRRHRRRRRGRDARPGGRLPARHGTARRVRDPAAVPRTQPDRQLDVDDRGRRFALMVAFAERADAAKLAFIIGAFMAGLALGRTDHHERIAADLGAVSNVFVPVFFVSIGVDADLEAMAQPPVIALAAVMTVIAIAGKVLAGWAVRGRRADRLLIGIGMIPRGEVGLIFASIGLAEAVLDEEQYGALLIVVLVSTVVTPPLLRWRLGRSPAADDAGDAGDAGDGGGEPEPEGGWVAEVDGTVVLRGAPPVRPPCPWRWPPPASPPSRDRPTSCSTGSHDTARRRSPGRRPTPTRSWRCCDSTNRAPGASST
ncbi:MAG: cation:proton antiporter [Ilumatobacteraceae bacterium]